MTGALSVTTAVLDGISLLHGPDGCAHHNFSLLHSTYLDTDRIRCLNLVSTGIREQEIIFGGEKTLEKAIGRAVEKGPGAVFVLSTCVAGTIGDDIFAVAEQEWDVPVIPVPSAGFLGGTFRDGFFQALRALSVLGDTGYESQRRHGVTVIGERNLEFEVDEHYREVERLCAALGLPVSLRFVSGIRAGDISRLGTSEVNILRDRSLIPLGESLKSRFGTPYVDSFPEGFAGSLRFLEALSGATGRDASAALREEKAVQEEICREFAGMQGAAFSLSSPGGDPEGRESALAVADLFGMRHSDGGTRIPLPVSAPVGSRGVRRLLHRWRRALHA
ncbi:MAG: nitrogenase component 1 [Methanoregulaceae archaeon]